MGFPGVFLHARLRLPLLLGVRLGYRKRVGSSLRKETRELMWRAFARYDSACLPDISEE
jgi:hypothetical protein